MLLTCPIIPVMSRHEIVRLEKNPDYPHDVPMININIPWYSHYIPYISSKKVVIFQFLTWFLTWFLYRPPAPRHLPPSHPWREVHRDPGSREPWLRPPAPSIPGPGWRNWPRKRGKKLGSSSRHLRNSGFKWISPSKLGNEPRFWNSRWKQRFLLEASPMPIPVMQNLVIGKPT